MKSKYTENDLKLAINSSKTWADVCRKLGVKPMTGSQTHLKNKALKLEIDTSHFLGKSAIKGRRSPNKKEVLDYCIKGSVITSHGLKLRLIKEGIKEEKCEICNISEWRGEKVVLELDHKDSDHSNNELNNLQILCPNCHALETRKRRNGPLT